jgi:hypothetical protein
LHRTALRKGGAKKSEAATTRLRPRLRKAVQSGAKRCKAVQSGAKRCKAVQSGAKDIGAKDIGAKDIGAKDIGAKRCKAVQSKKIEIYAFTDSFAANISSTVIVFSFFC